jgi:serine protease AprX
MLFLQPRHFALSSQSRTDPDAGRAVSPNQQNLMKSILLRAPAGMGGKFLRLLRHTTAVALACVLALGSANAGILVIRGDGVTISGADGVTISGADGVVTSGADGILSFGVNGITFSGSDGVVTSGADGVVTSGADGVVTSGADGVVTSGADGVAFTGTSGVVASGADGVTVSGADGVVISGADGVTISTADGTQRRADSVVLRQPSGVTVSGADGVTASGTNGVVASGADGVTISTADGVTVSGADGVTISTADTATGKTADGQVFTVVPSGVTVSGADNVVISGASHVAISGAEEITRTGAVLTEAAAPRAGLQSIDPELAVALDRATDDSTINAVVVYHRYPTEQDLAELQRIGVVGGTRFRVLPMVYATGTRDQLVEVSRLSNVRSIYGNRTLQWTADPGRGATGVERAWRDGDLTRVTGAITLTGRGVTVAVLDTGIDATHADLSGRVSQNVKLLDAQAAGAGFQYPEAVENLPNTDQVYGHGTFVAGVIGGSGARSEGLYTGVAPGARLVGLAAGDLSLVFVLSGFDYLLSRGATQNARVVNCSFSGGTIYDEHDPVNVATKMLTDGGVNVVFSAGNAGPGLHTLNPYAAAPWVVSVGAMEGGKLASFSSRGALASQQFRPTLVAPGVRVVSLRSSGVSVTGVEGPGFNGDAGLAPSHLPYYTTATGTSFSAPQVAGAIALMLEANPRLTPAEVRDILQRTATPLAPYYSHEVGAGMLNAHAAVIEAAFPSRRMGRFRSTFGGGQVSFVADTPHTFTGTVAQTGGLEAKFDVPEGALVASVQVGWGPLWSLNDLGMAIYDAGGSKRADVNGVNLPGLAGRRERALLASPSAGAWRVQLRNTLGLAGTPQEVSGVVEIMRAQYPALRDTGGLTAAQRDSVLRALRTFVMTPVGQNFRPAAAASRLELAAALVQGARVPQYVPAAPSFRDVRDLSSMLFVESCQHSPRGALFPDAQPGGQFSPNAQVDRLTAAVALVRAAGLDAEAQAKSDDLLLWLGDASRVPSNLRGYVSVAHSQGLLPASGNLFRPQAALTRLELAQSMAAMQNLLTK